MDSGTMRGAIVALVIAAICLAACVVKPAPAHRHRHPQVESHEKHEPRKHKHKKHKKHRKH